jgi:two-component system response regulator FixJ
MSLQLIDLQPGSDLLQLVRYVVGHSSRGGENSGALAAQRHSRNGRHIKHPPRRGLKPPNRLLEGDRMRKRSTIFVVDDAAATRDSLKVMFEAAELEVETYGSAEAFLAAYRPGEAGCLLLDLELPGVSGLELQVALQKRNIRLPIIFLTGRADVRASVRAIRAGAVDFLLKPTSGAELLERVRATLTGDSAAPELDSTRAAVDGMYAQLSPREREVMELVATGLSSKEIGRKLCISHRTVEIYRARLRKKTRTRSMVDLVRMADAFKLQRQTGALL